MYQNLEGELLMTNIDIVKEFNETLLKSNDVVLIEQMIAALDEYLRAIPGQKNEMPEYSKLPTRYRLPVLILANAILYKGYKPKPLSDDERLAYHPENHIMADGSRPRKCDYQIYIDFLEAAIFHLLKKQR